ncbi:unnamed protein product, partial [Ectocarpus sp. 13 AM-2016]
GYSGGEGRLLLALLDSSRRSAEARHLPRLLRHTPYLWVSRVGLGRRRLRRHD